MQLRVCEPGKKGGAGEGDAEHGGARREQQAAPPAGERGRERSPAVAAAVGVSGGAKVPHGEPGGGAGPHGEPGAPRAHADAHPEPHPEPGAAGAHAEPRPLARTWGEPRTFCARAERRLEHQHGPARRGGQQRAHRPRLEQRRGEVASPHNQPGSPLRWSPSLPVIAERRPRLTP